MPLCPVGSDTDIGNDRIAGIICTPRLDRNNLSASRASSILWMNFKFLFSTLQRDGATAGHFGNGSAEYGDRPISVLIGGGVDGE
mmetsp:Transcript_69461/g.185327  ORF Transcript_69461/g.185327 Transcript_69461/m.185327 type:complete len:85 (+) Transcript_69461:87-341(+)